MGCGVQEQTGIFSVLGDYFTQCVFCQIFLFNIDNNDS